MATLPMTLTPASILLQSPILPCSLLVALTSLPSIGSLLPISSVLRRFPKTEAVLLTTPPGPVVTLSLLTVLQRLPQILPGLLVTTPPGPMTGL